MEAGEGKGGWPVPGGSPHHPRGRCCGPDPPAVGRGLRIPCCSSPQPLPHPGPQVCLCWGQRLDGSGPAGPWDAGADFPVEALKSWLCCGHCCQPSDLMLCGCGVEVDSRVPGHPAQAPSPQRFLSLSRSFFLGNWEGGSRLSLLWPEHGLCAVSISSWVSLALLLPPLHVFSAPPPPRPRPFLSPPLLHSTLPPLTSSPSLLPLSTEMQFLDLKGDGGQGRLEGPADDRALPARPPRWPSGHCCALPSVAESLAWQLSDVNSLSQRAGSWPPCAHCPPARLQSPVLGMWGGECHPFSPFHLQPGGPNTRRWVEGAEGPRWWNPCSGRFFGGGVEGQAASREF